MGQTIWTETVSFTLFHIKKLYIYVYKFIFIKKILLFLMIGRRVDTVMLVNGSMAECMGVVFLNSMNAPLM